jgi:hypothetical protein
MGPNESLPALPFWQARSFWLTMIAAVVMLGNAFGFDILSMLGVADESAIADGLMQIVAAVSLVLAWGQRLAPNFRLTL